MSQAGSSGRRRRPARRPAARPRRPALPPDQTLEALLESQRRLQQIADTVPALIYIYDLIDERNVYVNREVHSMLGFTGEEIQEMGARLLPSLIHPEDMPALEQLRRRLETAEPGQIFERQFRARHRSGDWRWLRSREVVFSREPDGSPRQALGIATDITESRALEDRLRQAQQLESVGRVAGGIAHDFNNLLTAIVGYGELALDRSSTDESRRHDLQEILKAAARASDLTRKLLAFARKQIIEPREVDLNTLVHGAERLLRPIVGPAIELVSLPAGEPCAARVDAGQMELVLTSLAANAAEAMPAGGRLTIAVTHFDADSPGNTERRTALSGPIVALTVTDTGVGMDEDTRRRAFEPFFTTKPGGAGLGLATCYGIIRQAGGEIAVRSSPESGTTVEMHLPRVAARPVQHARVEPTAQARRSSRRAGDTITILVVDDEPQVRQLAAVALRNQGYEVLVAEGGREAVEAVRTARVDPDMIVTDVVMPGMNGKELAARLRAGRPGLPVLYISGFTDAVVAQADTREAGVFFLAKPFTTAELARKVRHALARSRSHL